MKQKETQQETMSKEKRVVFFEGKSWYHRTKELQDDLTTKYGKKGGFETPEEAEKSYWEYEKRYQKKQRDLQIAKMQKTDVMLGDYLEYWFENIFSPRIETTTRMVGAYMGVAYKDYDYVSCQENGEPRSLTAMNQALTKICNRNGLPNITVHGLRHMFATILIELGVPLFKISGLLGHSSVHTTYEYYCEIMDEQDKIIAFVNNTFVPQQTGTEG